MVGEVAGVFLASLQGVPLEEAMKAFRALLNMLLGKGVVRGPPP